MFLSFLGAIFLQRIISYFKSFQSDYRDRFNADNFVTRISLVAASIESDIRFQTLNVDNKLSIRRYSPAPPAFDVCACSVALNCPNPLMSGGIFKCQYGNNCTKGSVVWSVPGIPTACVYYERFLNADLRCFFNESCINTMLSMYNVDMPTRKRLPDAVFQYTPLNSSIPSNFPPTTKMDTLFSALLLESWSILPDYEGHYRNCAPVSCSYAITQRLQLLYVASTILSFFGGLVVVLRLLVPMLVRLTYWILIHGCHRRSPTIIHHPMDQSAGNT